MEMSATETGLAAPVEAVPTAPEIGASNEVMKGAELEPEGQVEHEPRFRPEPQPEAGWSRGAPDVRHRWLEPSHSYSCDKTEKINVEINWVNSQVLRGGRYCKQRGYQRFGPF